MSCTKMENLQVLDLPILVGISRKSMIYKYLGGDPTTSLNGTTVLNTLALQKGATILRVHDVKEAVEACKIYEKNAKCMMASLIQRTYLSGLSPNPSPKGRGVISFLGYKTLNW